MLDVDRDTHADGVRVTYSRPIRHAADRDGHYKVGPSSAELHDTKIEHGVGGAGGAGAGPGVPHNGDPGIAADVYPA